LFLFGATFFDKNVGIINENNEADNKTNHYTCVLKIDWREYTGDLSDRTCASHRAVVHSHKEDDELAEVADVGSVVVVGLRERQVDQVVKKKCNRNRHYYKCRELILVRRRHVEPKAHTVDDCYDEIGFFYASWLQFIFKLSETIFFCLT
jgi:hypothetical protein